MAVYAHDCFYCEATRAPLEIFGVAESQKVLKGTKTATLACQCPFCDEVTVLVLLADGRNGPSNWKEFIETDNKLSEDDFGVVFRRPAEPEDATLEGVPSNIAKIYRQAVQNKRLQNIDAAGVMFRKVLELSVYHKDGSATKNLAAALKAADTEGKLPKDFLDWAQEVRAFGNISAHSNMEPSVEELEEISGFTEMVLRYLFTMPHMLSQRRTRKANE